MGRIKPAMEPQHLKTAIAEHEWTPNGCLDRSEYVSTDFDKTWPPEVRPLNRFCYGVVTFKNVSSDMDRTVADHSLSPSDRDDMKCSTQTMTQTLRSYLGDKG